MTHAEQRAKAIDAMERAIDACGPNDIRLWAISAFNALHGIVRVVPLEVTEAQDRYFGMTLNAGILRELLSPSDLTNPEGK